MKSLAWLLLIPLLPLAALLLLSWHSRSGSPPGIAEGRLSPCPERPNCVGSELTDGSHRVEPLHFDGDPDAAWRRLRQVITRAGGRIDRDEGHYLHATFRTRLLRFVDDLECRLEPAAGVIHLRSASRVGRSDLGANRRRVAVLRRLYEGG